MSETAQVSPPVVLRAPGRDEVKSRIWMEKAGTHRRLTREAPFLVLASLVITGSLLLPTLKSHHLWFSIPCVFKTVTHLPCLACGLTRSFVFTAHGNLASAFRMHLLGPILFAATCGAVVYLGASLLTGYRVRYTLSSRSRRIANWSVLGIFLLCWGIKLAFIRSGW